MSNSKNKKNIGKALESDGYLSAMMNTMQAQNVSDVPIYDL